MGAASSHEIRQIVDQAVVALRSEQAGNVLDVSGDGMICDDGDNNYYYDYDDDDYTSESESECDPDSSGCGDCCCDWESECCYETMECCAGVDVWCSLSKNRGKRDKKKKKKSKTSKGFWAGCYPARRKGDWGGDVVGITRCPGEQDPKKWGFKTEPARVHHASGVLARHDCAGGSCGDVSHADRAGRHRHRTRDRNEVRGRHRRLGDDECDTHPKRGRRRTLLFDEFEAFPHGSSHCVDTPARTPTRHGRSSRGRRGNGRWTTDESEDLVMMHGALMDDRSDRGYGRRRARSWERRSDPDDRVGEIDDRTDDSYGMGERMVVSRPRPGDEGRRVVRFHRA